MKPAILAATTAQFTSLDWLFVVSNSVVAIISILRGIALPNQIGSLVEGVAMLLFIVIATGLIAKRKIKSMDGMHFLMAYFFAITLGNIMRCYEGKAVVGLTVFCVITSVFFIAAVIRKHRSDQRQAEREAQCETKNFDPSDRV